MAMIHTLLVLIVLTRTLGLQETCQLTSMLATRSRALRLSIL